MLHKDILALIDNQVNEQLAIGKLPEVIYMSHDVFVALRSQSHSRDTPYLRDSIWRFRELTIFIVFAPGREIVNHIEVV